MLTMIHTFGSDATTVTQPGWLETQCFLVWNTRCEQKLTGTLYANEKPHLNAPAFSAAAILRVLLWCVQDLSQSSDWSSFNFSFIFQEVGNDAANLPSSLDRDRRWRCVGAAKNLLHSRSAVRADASGVSINANKWFKNMAILLLLSLIAIGFRMCRSWHWSFIKNFDRVQGLFRWRGVRLDFQGVI